MASGWSRRIRKRGYSTFLSRTRLAPRGGHGFVYSENETADDVLAFLYYPLYRAARVFMNLEHLRLDCLTLGYELPPEQPAREGQ